MSLTSIFIFFIILLVLVIVHEFGHFIVAKFFKFRVDEFAFGFPPRLWAKKRGETTYAINALPIGGYVSIYGETEDDKQGRDPRAFNNRPWWAQSLVLIAGVVMNMLLALFVYITLAWGSVPVTKDHPLFEKGATDVKVTVVEVTPNSPAANAGIVPGATIVGLSSGKDIALLDDADKAVAFIQAHPNQVKITYEDLDEQRREVTLAAVYGLIPDMPDKKLIGLGLDTIGIVKTTPVEAIKLGFSDTVAMTQLVWGGFTTLATNLVQGERVLDQVAGPIGIAKVVNQASAIGTDSLLSLVALLSINLAFFNALPFPALDGGRLVIVLGEAISRRKMPMKAMQYLNALGFGLLMLLLIVVTVKDVVG